MSPLTSRPAGCGRERGDSDGVGWGGLRAGAECSCENTSEEGDESTVLPAMEVSEASSSSMSKGSSSKLLGALENDEILSTSLENTRDRAMS